MNVTDLPIQGLKLFENKLFHDDRGFFTERFVKSRFAEHGLTQEFIQDNHSHSKPGVVRGLHYQHSPGQGKLIGVVRGKIWDVALDLRAKSPTFGKWYGVELTDTNGLMVWIPAGFAHGFCVLGNEPADVLYKVDAPYSPKTEGGIRFDDPTVQIPWPIKAPILNSKDLALQTFKEYATKPVF